MKMIMTNDQVRALRWLIELGYTQAYVAVNFHVSQAWVSYVATGKRRIKAGGPIQPVNTSRTWPTRRTLGRAMAEQVREERANGALLLDLAAKYGVTVGAISRICSGKTYASR